MIGNDIYHVSMYDCGEWRSKPPPMGVVYCVYKYDMSRFMIGNAIYHVSMYGCGEWRSKPPPVGCSLLCIQV